MVSAPAFALTAMMVSLAFLAGIVLAVAVAALHRGGRREDATDPYDALVASRFTIPVSLIVPASGEAAGLSPAVGSLLSLNYPELEVIAVAEDLTESGFDHLKAEWDLEPKEFFYRRTLTTTPIRRIYGSRRDARLMVVDKPAAGKADALNCGLSLARYRYVASMPPTISLDSNALLRLMSPALRDPATVLAVAGHVEPRADGSMVAAFQWIASVRSWMMTRLTWSRLRCGLGPPETAVVWRRDALLELGGFSPAATDPELQMLGRLQTSTIERVTGQVIRSTEIVGRTEPVRVLDAARSSGRRQRAVLESLVRLSPFDRSLHGRLPVICVGIAELLVPLLQVSVLVTAVALAAAGWLAWATVLFVLSLLTFGNAIVTASALLLRGAAPDAPSTSELTRLLVLSPLEFCVYRPAVALAALLRIPFALR